MNKSKQRYSLMNHTSDIGVEVTGENFSKLMENGAFALFDLIADLSTVDPTYQETINIPEENAEDQFRTWLEKLLLLHNIDSYLLTKFEVNINPDGKIVGNVWGEQYKAEKHTLFSEIKAITYHQFQVIQTERGWSASFILDV